ncbi:tetraspanin-5-like [Amphiura filiformis]|uniref:tetraspanin-5-like n=1 Tax=Amphiura filiformis TaxID=82378 RepID=UPI003B20DD58
MGCLGDKDDGPSEVSLVIKYLLFAINLISWIIGLILVGIGIWAWYDRGALDGQESFNALIESPIVDPSWWLVVLGAIIFLIGTAGCLGALRENTILLTIYKVALGLVILLEIGGGVAIYYYSDYIEAEVGKQIFNHAIPGYRENPDFQDLVDTIQSEVQCCGVNSYNDWEENIYFNCEQETVGDRNRANPEACGVPFSCCKFNQSDPSPVINTQCGYNVRDENFDAAEREERIYTVGCVTEFQSWLIARFNLYVLAGVGGGILVVEIIGFCLALTLGDSIKRQKSKWAA